MFNINKTVDKIFDEGKGKEFKNIINKFLNWSVGILIALVIILLCSIFGLEFDWGIVDRDILISVVPTVLGGYFGFVGSVIGIMGAYLILKEQMFQEKKRLDKELNEKSNLELELLVLLLESTIRDTDKVVYGMTRVYVDLFKKDLSDNYNGNQIFSSKLDDIKECKHNKFFSDIILAITKDGAAADGEYFKRYLSNSRFEVDERLLNSKYKKVYEDIYDEFNNINDYKALVYDKNWSKYVINIKGKVNENEVTYTEKAVIIYINKWLSLLESMTIENNLNKLNSIDINISYDIPTGHKIENKKNQIKKELANHIKEFIYNRDIIIEILSSAFTTELDGISNSYNHLEEHFLTAD